MTQAPSDTIPTPRGALRAEGPWLRDGNGRKVMLRGVTYGPFKPNAQGDPWPEPSKLGADVAQIRSLGFDSLRIYERPTDVLLKACEDHQMNLVCGIPWIQHVDFMTEQSAAEDARRRVVEEATRLGRHPCVAAILVGNEIEKTLVRWMGPERVLEFIESLIALAQRAAPGKLVSYASYPSTEYLVPRNSDFIACNVFLEQREAFAHYVQHLQNLAPGRPLVITEFGMDGRTHGEAAQAEAFAWCREVCAAQGVAGSFWFSFTDEWHRGGEEVTGWEFGLVRRDRSEKAACEAARKQAQHAESLGSASARDESIPPSALHLPPSTITVIVCTRNGAATLRPCLEALGRQSHRNYEVLVIDDGSTDETPDIAKSFPFVRYERQVHSGLSAARNRGMDRAAGDLLAYTDDDCIPDEDWLLQVSRAFSDPRCAAAGGPNLPPAPRTGTEACVAVAPGAPSHVLLDDLEAEHLPGCNLVIRKSALRAIGGFREEFTCAGDDVDVCWRLQSHGGKLRFIPSAVVWHHRRRTTRAYLRQQRGYGHAEAMLIRRYPHRFAWLGGARWRGMIYGDTPPHLLHTGAVIRFGRFGNALFQTVYATSRATAWDWMTGLPWLAIALVLFPLSFVWSNAWLLGCSMLLLMFAAAWRRTRILPQDGPKVPAKHMPLLWLMCLLQPVVRDWGRLSGMVRLNAWPKGRVMWPWPWKGRSSDCTLLAPQAHWWRETFWSESGIDREALLQSMRHLCPQFGLTWTDGDERSACDATLQFRNGWRRVFVATVTEFHEHGRSLTRIAWGERHPLWKSRIILGVAAVLILARYLNTSSLLWFAIVLLIAAGWRFRAAAQIQSAARRLVSAAAVRCGLSQHDGMEQINPAELHERVLASTGRSAEL